MSSIRFQSKKISLITFVFATQDKIDSYVTRPGRLRCE